MPVATAENPETVKRLHNSLFLSITWLFHAALKQRETDCNSRDQRSALCQRLCARRDLPRARRKSFWTAASFSAAFMPSRSGHSSASGSSWARLQLHARMSSAGSSRRALIRPIGSTTFQERDRQQGIFFGQLNIARGMPLATTGPLEPVRPSRMTRQHISGLTCLTPRPIAAQRL